jgi:protocatechuate 3,4-dioxygenase beta subunit
MSRDTLILIALAVILAVAGVAVYFILGEGEDTGFVPPDKTFLEAEDEALDGTRARRDQTVDLDPNAVGQGPASLRNESEVPRSAEVALGDEKTGIRGLVRDPSGKPVAAAVAALYEDKSDIAQMSFQGAFIGVAETGVAGRFSFEGVRAGMRYMVRVEHPEFASASQGGIEIEDKGVVELVVPLDLGLRLEGEVKDEGGNPIAGARVRVTDQQARAVDPTLQIEREVETGLDGKFVFPHVNEGYKRVTASKETYATETMAAVQLRKGTDPDFLSFTLGAGVELRGRVVDQDGEPVPDAVVSAEPVRRRVDRTAPVGNYPPVKSDETGEFVFSGVEEGTFRLVCMKKGYGLARRISAQTSGDPVTITMRRSPVLRGRVVDAETGEPVKKFKVTLARQEAIVFTPSQQTQFFTSEDGSFEYIDVNMKSDFFVHAVGPGYAWGSSTAQVGNGSDDIENVEIRLSKGGTIRGRIIDSDGRPVAGARVDVMPQADYGNSDGAPFINMLTKNMRRAQKTATTDAQGRYVVEQVQAGSFKAKARHSDFATSTHELATVFAGQGELQMPDLMMMRGATVIGVVEERDGKSGANCLVRISPKGSGGFGGGGAGGESYAKRSDEAGRFRFDNVKPGLYWVDVTERGGDPGNFLSDLIGRNSRTEIMVADGETREVRVK